jgi:hypothetical protein
MRDETARGMMLEIAAAYERLAEYAPQIDHHRSAPVAAGRERAIPRGLPDCPIGKEFVGHRGRAAVGCWRRRELVHSAGNGADMRRATWRGAER